MKSAPRMRLAVELAVVALLYVAAARLGFLLASLHHVVSPVWPATGLALAALLILGTRAWPAIAAGAFVANAFTDIPLPAAAAIACGNTLEALAGASIVRAIRERPTLGTMTEPAALATAGVLAPLPSALAGTLVLAAVKEIPLSNAGSIFGTWWVGDALGALVLAPAILAVAEPQPGPSRPAETMAITGAAGVLAAVIFDMHGGAPLLFAVFPVLLGSAIRLGRRGVALTALAICAAGVFGTAGGAGPFHGGTLNANLIHLQLFLASVALTGLALAATRPSPALMVPALVLVVGWAAGATLSISFGHEQDARDEVHMDRLVESSEQALVTRLSRYVDALIGGAALHVASRHVEPEEWTRYVRQLDLERRHPGLFGMSMIVPVRRSELETFVAETRGGGAPGFTVEPLPGTPAGREADELFVVTAIEPELPGVPGAGLDIGSDPHRRRVAESARDSGEPRLSPSMALVRDREHRVGFALMVPYYRTGVPLDSLLARRAAHRGWVAAAFVAEELFHNMHTDEIGVRVYDGELEIPGALLFDSATRTRGAIDRTTHVEIAGRTFTMAWSRSPSFASARDRSASLFGGGAALLALLLAGLVASLQSSGRRAQALVDLRTRELRASEERFELAVRGSHDGIWDWDVRSGELYYSPRFHELLDYAPGGIGADGASIIALVHPDDLSRVIGASQAHVVRREPFDVELRMKTSRGDWRWVRARGQAVWNGAGEPVRMAGSMTDIRASREAAEELRRARDAALDAVRARSEFLANMSHEIITPINGVIGTAELLAGMDLDDEQREYVQTIQSSGSALRELIDDILDFSRIEARKLELESVPFSLGDLLDEAVRIVSPRARERGLVLDWRLDDDVPDGLVGDPGRIRQVLLNLTTNAVKFTDKGCVNIRVRLLSRSAEGAELRFSVEDTGIGIPESKRQKIFEAFTQADGSMSRRYGGVGLGLAICAQLAQLMGGKIELESELGKGSTFHMTLRLGIARFGGTTVDEVQVEASAARPLEVLVAEDNPVNRMVVERLLGRRGHHVTSVADGEAAVEIASRRRFDVILMDVQMPGMDGFEATAAIRKEDAARGRRLPIVALTAHAFRGFEEKCTAAGMDSYLAKPVDPTKLFAMVEGFGGRPSVAPRARTLAPPPARFPSVDVFDKKFALEQAGDDEAVLGEVIVLLRKEIDLGSAAIARSLDERDARGVATAAHRLKGSFASLGARRAADAAKRLEKAGASGEVEALPPLVTALHQEIETLGPALDKAANG